jgi:hypothetical protein
MFCFPKESVVILHIKTQVAKTLDNNIAIRQL